jgi:hypothetical protein
MSSFFSNVRNKAYLIWFYIGNRCTSCNVLGSCMDYSIDYGPTYEMERELSLK